MEAVITQIRLHVVGNIVALVVSLVRVNVVLDGLVQIVKLHITRMISQIGRINRNGLEVG